MCVNLYPFERTIARGDASEAEAIENIDIGGPTMIRAAAKNQAFAAVVVDPEDYGDLLGELRESGGTSVAGAPQTARGEGVRVHRPLRRGDLDVVRRSAPTRASRRRGASAYEKVSDLRYGENPHQSAAFYARVAVADAPARRAWSSCTGRSCRSTTCST